MSMSAQTVKLKRLGVLSVGLITGIIYAIFGLFAGLFITLISVTVSGAFDEAGLGVLFGVGSIIILPIVYGIGGFIAGLISALIYNIAAKFTGLVKWASKWTMFSGANLCSPRTTGKVIAWSPPTTTGNDPFSTAFSTAVVILAKFWTTSEGTMVIFPQSARVMPRNNSS